MNAAFILQELLSVADPEKAISLRGVRIKKRLYAEGDVILGITVPLVRNIVKKIAKKNPAIPLNEIQILLDSEYHEVRLAGFLFLVKQFKFRKTTETERKEIYNFYLKNIRRANNWDLVDVSCRDIIGRYLLDKTDRSILYRLAESDNIWEQRMSIMSTWILIKNRQFDDTFAIAEKLQANRHFLVHKAIGWMLREVGRRDLQTLAGFLETHCQKMPYTALQYAVGHFPPDKRAYFMKKKE